MCPTVTVVGWHIFGDQRVPSAREPRLQAQRDRNRRARKVTDSRVIVETARWMRRRMEGDPKFWPDLRTTVVQGLAETGHPPALMAGLLGTLLTRPVDEQGGSTLRAVMADAP